MPGKRACLRKTTLSTMKVLVLKVGRAEAVPGTLLVDLPEQHLSIAVPGHLSEFIDSRDQ